MIFSEIKKYSLYLFFTLIFIGLFFVTEVNYLLFHCLAEIFSIVVAFSFFSITWNSRSYIKNKYLLFIGVAYLFIAFIDLMHTLSYKGMPIFTDYDFYANQLWIGARYMESLTILIAFNFLKSDRSFKVETVFIIYLIITALLIASVFHWKVFPECFVEGAGLTPFKKISEYIICSILLFSIILLFRSKNKFTDDIFKMLLFSIIFTIISELAFTFYISNYGLSNLVGHYFKLFSFFLIYKSIIETGIRKPYKLIFNELNRSNEDLKTEISAHKKTAGEKEDLIKDLKIAISEVQTLSGLLPICMHCKKVRDDKGYWNKIESYIMERSDAKFSHSICQDCADKYYPDLDIYNDED